MGPIGAEKGVPEMPSSRQRAQAAVVLTVLLVGFTALQAYLRQYDFPNFVLHAVFNLNFALLLTLLVLLGRNLFKLQELRRSPRARGGLPVRLVLYTLGLLVPITLIAFIGLTERLMTAAERWFEPPIDRMLDDALELSERSLEIACAATDGRVQPEMEVLLASVRKQVADYKEAKALHIPVRKSYVLALGLLALAALFSATWAAFKVAHGISAPISALADTAQAIAEGRDALEPHVPIELRHDAPAEIHTLVRSFEHMRRTLHERSGQLEDAHGRLQTILRDTSAGVLALDSTGIVTLANRQAELMLGLHEVQATLPPLLVSMLGLVQRTGRRAGPTEIAFDAPDGRRVLSATVSPLETESGAAVVVLEDLTELLQAQRLAAWQEAAQRVAHEIKNPLTPIQLSAQRLRKRSSELPEELRDLVAECTDTIIEEVDTMRRLVNDFSQFARLPRAQPVRSDLNALVRAVASLFSPESAGTIVLDLSPDLPPLMLDPDLMRQVLVNLVKNGLEATEGAGPVRVSTALSAEAECVRLTVTDFGAGIAPELLDKLFLPHFSTKGGGTGLGLAIVRQIVNDHQGHVRIRNATGGGAAVVVELPLS